MTLNEMAQQDWLVMAGFVLAILLLSGVVYMWVWRRGQPGKQEELLNAPAIEPERQKEVHEILVGADGPSPAPELAPLEVVEEEKADLRVALAKTKSSFLDRLKLVFTGGQGLQEEELESLEEILYTSDLGPQTVQQLMNSVQEKLPSRELANFESVRQALKSEMLGIFEQIQKNDLKLNHQPTVWMIVGVNGAGKTTTIGKLAAQLAKDGKKVLVAAGDTFRAAAGSQLRVWTERAQVEIFEPPQVTDPSAVAFDACQKAIADKYDVVLIDTAGRLHTAKNLMEELKKMKRVIAKVLPEAPHEVLIVLDANSGQNALIQAREFHQALNATGVVLTKLDGTAKGGVAVGVACELHLPVCLIGVGEKIQDLQPFSATEFVDSIL